MLLPDCLKRKAPKLTEPFFPWAGTSKGRGWASGEGPEKMNSGHLPGAKWQPHSREGRGSLV